MSLTKPATYFLATASLAVLINYQAEAGGIALGLECELVQFNNQSPSGDEVYMKDQIVGSEVPKKFFIQAKTTRDPLKTDDGNFHSNKNGYIGHLEGEFSYLLNGNLAWWIEETSKYVFETVPDSDGRLHSVSLNRYTGMMNHFIGLTKDRGTSNGLSYFYENCRKTADTPRF